MTVDQEVNTEHTLVRYTYPERLSSRRSLQLQPRGGHFTSWTELHLSRLLPAYAIQSILKMSEELERQPSQQIAKVLCTTSDPQVGINALAEQGIYAPRDLIFASPFIVEIAPLGESFRFTLETARSRGWPELPVPFVVGALICGAQALAHFHKLGWTHGAISSESFVTRYAVNDPESPLGRVQGREGVCLNGWVEGNLFQLTPEAARYGRGPRADCRALLWTILELLGGEPSQVHLGHAWEPTSVLSGELASAQLNSGQTQAALAQLPSSFAQWIQQRLQDPPESASVMLRELQKILDPQQPALDRSGLSGWLSRLVPERLAQWGYALSDPAGQSIPMLLPTGGVLTVHKVKTSPQAPSSLEKTPRLPESSVSNIPIVAGTSSAQPSESPEPSNLIPDASIDVSATDASATDASVTPLPPRIRVAVLWMDTILEVHDFGLDQPITLGSSEGVDIALPEEVLGPIEHTLIAPLTSQEVICAPLNQPQGWVSATAGAPRDSWGDQGETQLSQGGMSAMIWGDFGVFIHLYQPDPPEKKTLARVISPKNMGLIWSGFAAYFIHLLFLLSAYSSGPQIKEEITVVAAQQLIEASVIIDEEVIEKLEEPEPPPEEPSPSTPPQETEQFSESRRVEDQIKQIAKQRFKGPQAARKLASAIAGGLSLEGSLSLGDVSAALNDSLENGLAQGSSLGEIGGSLNTGGGPRGSLNTSGGLEGAQAAGALKAKRVSRKVKGRVKTLKSRVRIRGGSLSKAEVFKVISQNQARISACYERQLTRDPNLSGKLTVSWVINTSGRVEQVKQVLSSVKSAPMKTCVFKIIKRMRFPKPKGGKVKIKYPFVFQRG